MGRVLRSNWSADNGVGRQKCDKPLIALFALCLLSFSLILMIVKRKVDMKWVEASFSFFYFFGERQFLANSLIWFRAASLTRCSFPDSSPTENFLINFSRLKIGPRRFVEFLRNWVLLFDGKPIEWEISQIQIPPSLSTFQSARLLQAKA